VINVQTQCCQFFKILIKKRVDVFLQMVVRVLATRVGRSYLQRKKLKIGKKKLCTIEKIKNKKLEKLYTIQKVKTKNYK